MVIELEIREIVRYLSDGDRVLDVGCANGYSSIQFASRKRVDVRGVDYIPEMVDQARRRAASMASALSGRVEFEVGEATALQEPDESFDKVIVVRVVINLGDWERQRVAMLECARVVRPGGLVLLSEATIQGWQRLNKLRREWGLADIPMPPFNQYLDQDAVVESAVAAPGAGRDRGLRQHLLGTRPEAALVRRSPASTSRSGGGMEPMVRPASARRLRYASCSVFRKPSDDVGGGVRHPRAGGRPGASRAEPEQDRVVEP
jgi:SAM-dependent methyltransferase